MKKWLSLLLMLTMVSTMPAAATGLDPTDVVINVLICTQNQNDDLANTYFQAFAEAHGITVNCELAASTGYADMLTLAMVEQKQGYDLVMVNSNHWGALIEADWIIPLDDYIEKEQGTEWYDGIMTSALDACVVDGKRWSVAYSAGSSILMYNKQLFEQAGLDPEKPPKTLDEMLEYAERLNNPDKGVFGLAFRGGQERNSITLPWVMNYLYEGGSWYPEGRPTIAIFDTPEAQRASEIFQAMYQYAPEGIDGYTYTEAMTAMQQGYAAMLLDAATLAVNLLDPDQTDLYDQFGFTAIEGKASWGDGWCFSIGSRSAHKDWCWELIKVATSYDTALDQIMRKKAISCYRTDVYGQEQIYDVLPSDLVKAVEDSASIANIVYWPLISQKAEIVTHMTTTLYDIAHETISIEQGMAELNQIVIDILERDGVPY